MNALSLIEKIACLSDEDKIWLERIIDRLLATPRQKKGCGCHVVDPKKSNMIIWPSRNSKHTDDLIVKFTDQRFIAMPRIDKRGEKYWKVRDFYENEENEPEIGTSSSPTSSEINQPSNLISNTDRLAKFQVRQAQAQQIQSQKEETKWINGNEVLTQLANEKAERKAQSEAEQANTQVQANAPQEEIKENASNSTT